MAYSVFAQTMLQVFIDITKKIYRLILRKRASDFSNKTGQSCSNINKVILA